MAYPMNALDWYRKNRAGLVGFGGFNGFGTFGADRTNSIPINTRLQPGECLISQSGAFAACLTGGNFYIHRHNDPTLSLVKVIGGGGRAAYVTMQGDGNLVAYDSANRAVWASNTWKKPASYLQMQDDGNLVIYSATRQALWASNTAGTVPYRPPPPPPPPPLPPPPPPPPPPSGPTPEEIRQREAEEKTRLAKIEADRQRALAEKALEDKLRAERDSAAAKLAADRALIDASRNAADLQKQIDAQAALDKLAATEREKAAADLAAAKAEAAAYEASLKAEQAKGPSTVLTGQALAPQSAPPSSSSGPSPLLYVGLAALGALLLLKKKG